MADAAESDTPTPPAQPEEPRAASVLVDGGAAVRQPVDRMEQLHDIELHVDVEVGRTVLPISRIVALGKEAVITLDKLAGESVDICVNHEKLATGEIIVIQDKMRVRVIEIVDQQDEEDA